MQRLIIQTRDGLFNIRDHHGEWIRNLNRDEVTRFATKSEIRDAKQRHEAAQYPLPQFDPDSGLYYWPPDQDDRYTHDEIADDVRKLWPLMDPAILLESSRLMARLPD